MFICVILFAVLRGVLRYAEQYSNHNIAFRLLALIRDQVFRALRRLSPAKLEGRDKGNLISIITSDNEGSLRFHRKNGFTEIGVMPAVAFKFGKYLDVSFFQKRLG